MSTREARIAAQHRNQYQQLRQVNRLFAQKLASGMSVAEAATSQGSGQVTISDGQTLDKIASANGTTVPDLLSANPDLTAPKTGMVINLPNNYDVSLRGRGVGRNFTDYANQYAADNGFGPAPDLEQLRAQGSAGGLPSNAALGGLTTNAVNQVPNNYNASLRGRGTGRNYTDYVNQYMADAGYPQKQNNFNPFPSLGASSQLPAQPNLAPRPQTAPTYNPFAYSSPIQQYSAQSPLAGLFNNPSAEIAKASTPAPLTPSTPPVTAFAPRPIPKDDYIPHELAVKATLAGYTPNPNELALMQTYGLIQKTTPPPAYQGGGGGYRGRGGHHRGGGGGRGGHGGTGRGTGGPKTPSLPAFSSGAGFNGLVNWRI